MMRSVAIVGAGIGKEHLAGYAALPDRFRVKVVCDLDTARAEGIVAGHEGVAVTDDLGAVLADESIDIIDVCLPPHLHFKTCMAALDAGKIVVCEKPLVASLDEADKLMAKADRDRRPGISRVPVSLWLGHGAVARADRGRAGGAVLCWNSGNPLGPACRLLRCGLARHLGRRTGRCAFGSCDPYSRSCYLRCWGRWRGSMRMWRRG